MPAAYSLSLSGFSQPITCGPDEDEDDEILEEDEVRMREPL